METVVVRLSLIYIRGQEILGKGFSNIEPPHLVRSHRIGTFTELFLVAYPELRCQHGAGHCQMMKSGEPLNILNRFQNALVRKNQNPNIIRELTDDIETQREQFIRINNSKPLPKGLVEELLPEVTIPISGRFTASKIASTIINQLNLNKRSPFCGMIRRASSTLEERKSSIIQDGPLSRVIKESINHMGDKRIECIF